MVVLRTVEQEVRQAIHQLPPLPRVVSKLIELVESENATIDQIEELIATDPVLTAKVLHLANSAYYGLSRSIGTVKQALLVLGFHTVKNLVLGIAVMSAMRSGRHPTPVEIELWEHAYTCAGIAREIGRKARMSPRNLEDTYMAGLLHDIGRVLLVTRFPTHYQETIEHAPQYATLLEAEKAVLGTDHAVVGSLIAEKWNLPSLLVQAIGEHHAPSLPEGARRPILAAVMLADYWSHLQTGGEEGGILYPTPPAEVSALFSITEAEQEAIIQKVLEHVGAIRQVIVG